MFESASSSAQMTSFIQWIPIEGPGDETSCLIFLLPVIEKIRSSLLSRSSERSTLMQIKYVTSCLSS